MLVSEGVREYELNYLDITTLYVGQDMNKDLVAIRNHNVVISG